MDNQIYKKFLNNMPHGYVLLKATNNSKYNLVESNTKFKGIFNIKDKHISNFSSVIKNNKMLGKNLTDGIDYLINNQTNEYVSVFLNYNIVFNRQILNNEEHILIMILDVFEKAQNDIGLYESFINSIDEMVFICDGDGNILFTNKTANKRLRYTQKEFEDINILDLYVEEKQKEATKVFNNIFRQERLTFTLPVMRKDGSHIPVETYFLLGQWDGKERIFALAKNLSPEQKALQKFTKVFKRNPAPMAIVSLSSKIFTQVNDSFLELYGFSKEEIVGKTGSEFSIFPEYEVFEIYGELSSINFIYKKNLKTYKKNGEIVYCEISGEIIESQGEKIILISIIDTTEQSRYEQELIYKSELQEILLYLASRYINCSLDNYDKEINQSLEKVGKFVNADRVYIFNYDFERSTTSNSFEWCGKDISPQIEFLQDIPLDTIPDWVSSHIKGKTIIIKNVSSLDKETSSVREILEAQGVKSLITIPMMFQNECLGFVGFDSVRNHRIYTDSEIDLLEFYVQVLVNIHMRKLYEKDILTAEDKARKANEAKSLFIAKTSHELRNPLNGALGFLNLLEEVVADQNENLLSHVSYIKKSLKSAVRIANDLLSISRIESNDYEFKYSKINVYQLIDESIKPYIQQMKEREIKLNFVCGDIVQQDFIADYHRLKEIIGNLVSNAIIHSGANTIEIGCKTIKQNTGVEELLFHIKDNGIGISESHQEQIFNYFYKITHNSEGTGLGLPIIKELIGRMGGEIWLESSKDGGSTFFFSLPLNLKEAQLLKKTDSNGDIQNLNKLKIIMAEDDPINQALMMELFKRKGISITIVSNGAELLQLLENDSYNLILMDIQMPVMDGLETTKIIRKSKNMIPIIALTAAILPEEKDKYYNFGINGIVEKPISVDSLMEEIGKLYILSNKSSND